MTTPLEPFQLDELRKAKEAWLAACMKKIMPEDIYSLAYSKRSRDVMKVAKYLSANSIRINEYQDGVSEVVSGNPPVVIGRFKMEVIGKKLELSVQTPDPLQKSNS